MHSVSRGSGAKLALYFSLTPLGFISPTLSVLLARGRAVCPGEADKDAIHLTQTIFSSPVQGSLLWALPCHGQIADSEHHFLLLFSPFGQATWEWACWTERWTVQQRIVGEVWQWRVLGLGWSDLTSGYWDFSAKTNTPAEVWKSPCQHC